MKVQVCQVDIVVKIFLQLDKCKLTENINFYFYKGHGFYVSVYIKSNKGIIISRLLIHFNGREKKKRNKMKNKKKPTEINSKWTYVKVNILTEEVEDKLNFLMTWIAKGPGLNLTLNFAWYFSSASISVATFDNL